MKPEFFFLAPELVSHKQYEALRNDAGEVVKVNPVPDSSRILPYWLMSSYLVLTFAELFLSPMGLSFVSKVAPLLFQGIMQGGWLLATAVGNKLLFIGSFFGKRSSCGNCGPSLWSPACSLPPLSSPF